MSLTERQIREAVGSAAQLPAHRPLHVPEQLPCQQQGKAAGFEEHGGSAHFHHVLQDESK